MVIDRSFAGSAAPASAAVTLDATVTPSSPGCNLDGGFRISWTGLEFAAAATDGQQQQQQGVAVPLDQGTNGALTASLYLPAGALSGGVRYAFSARACFTRGPAGAACGDATTVFAAQLAPLALGSIPGGGAVVTDRRPYLLDASSLVRDPDGLPGVYSYSWACATAAGTPCLGPDGAPFAFAASGDPPAQGAAQPLLLAGSPPIAAGLPGAPGGTPYNITVTVRKGDRQATASAQITVVAADLPTARPLPLDRPKALPGAPLSVTAEVAPALGGGSVSLAWSLVSGPPGGAVIPLSWDLSQTSLPANVTLSIPGGALLAGGTYVFRLTATGADGGTATTDVTVTVAAPPGGAGGAGGGTATVSPANGTAVTTVFRVRAADWSADPSDGPLEYQLSYQVSDNVPEVFKPFDSNPMGDLRLPWISGATGSNAVSIITVVRNTFGLNATVARNITVEWPTLTTTEVQGSFIGAATALAQEEINRGTPAAAITAVSGISSLINALSTDPDSVTGAGRGGGGGGSSSGGGAAAAPPPPAASVIAREQFREALLGVLADSIAVAPGTPATVLLAAQAVGAVVAAPSELTPAAQLQAVSIIGDLVASATTAAAGDGSGGPAATLPAATASALMDALSSVAVGALPSLSGEVRMPPPPPRLRQPSAPRGAPLPPRPPPRPSPPTRLAPPPGAPASAVNSGLLANISSILDVIRDSQLQRLLAGSSSSSSSSEQPPLVLQAETIFMQVQLDDASSASSRLFTTGLAVPGSDARFEPLPAALAAALASSGGSGGGRVMTELLSVDFNFYALDAEQASQMGGITRLRFIDPATGLELNVSGLPMPVVFQLPTPPSLVAAQQAAAAGVSTAAKATCTFWSPELRRFSDAGCAAAPNPRPGGLDVSWGRGLSVADTDTLRVSYSVSANDALLDGCQAQVLDCGQVNAAARAAAAGAASSASTSQQQQQNASSPGQVFLDTADPFSGGGATCPPDSTGKFIYYNGTEARSLVQSCSHKIDADAIGREAVSSACAHHLVL